MIGTIRFLFAGIASLTLAFLFVAPAKAAPLAGAFAPVVEDNVVSVARRCWYRSNGRLVCAHKARPYYAPYCNCPAYRYGYRRPYYYPRYYVRPYYYGYYRPYYYRPYYQPYYYSNQFYLEYDRPYRIYEGPVYYNPW